MPVYAGSVYSKSYITQNSIYPEWAYIDLQYICSNVSVVYSWVRPMHVGGIQYARLSKERFSSAGGASSMAGQMVYVCVRVFFVLCFFSYCI